MAVAVGVDYHLSFTSLLPPPPGEWEDLYNAMDFEGLDDWYDGYTGRQSTLPLLDLGGQLTVTTAWLNANLGNDYVEQVDGRWIIHDIHCANIRITSAGTTPLPITFRDCYIQRRGASYLYCIHTPTSVAAAARNLVIENCTIDGENKDSYAVYFPGALYAEDDITVRRCHIHGFQSGIHATRGTTVQECLIHDLYYFVDAGGPSHNTAMSFRGGWGKAIRNRIRPGTQGSSGINFYAELGNTDPDVLVPPTTLVYNHLYCVENLIEADHATVTVQFPDADDPSILYSPLYPGMTRDCHDNFVDERFSNSELWQFFNNNRLFDGSPAPG